VIIGFDLGAAPSAGRAIAASDVVDAAALTIRATVIVGPTGWGARAARRSRPDWDDVSATWNEYKAGSAWTTAGGDVTTPPADVAFASPLVTGDFTITGLEEHVDDARVHRAGLLLLRLKPDVEADPNGISAYFSGGDLHTVIGPRLTVTYTPSEPSPISRPRQSRPTTALAHPGPTATGARAAQPGTPARASRSRTAPPR
jgi:hypothetical protein